MCVHCAFSVQFALNDKLNMEKEAQGGKQSAEDKRRAVEVTRAYYLLSHTKYFFLCL